MAGYTFNVHTNMTSFNMTFFNMTSFNMTSFNMTFVFQGVVLLHFSHERQL